MSEQRITIPLKQPLKSRGFFGTNVTDVITFRKPLMKDLIGLDFTGASLHTSMAILASRLSGVPVEDIGEMGMDDWYAVSHALGELTAPPPPPKKSAP